MYPHLTDHGMEQCMFPFDGNELVDAFTAWVFYNVIAHPMLPLQIKRCVSQDSMAPTTKTKQKDTSHLWQRNKHTSLHISSNSAWYVHSTKLDNTPYQGVCSTLWIEGYPPHTNM